MVSWHGEVGIGVFMKTDGLWRICSNCMELD